MKSGKFGFIGKAVLMVLLLAVALIGGHSTRGAAGTEAVSPFSSEQVIFSFLHGDGNFPSALIRDTAGNLYGTTNVGGSGHAGNVFELSPKDGGWSFSVLHAFGLTSGDGKYPLGALTEDADGKFYGTTSAGGTCSSTGCGTVYEVSPQPGGGWTERVLYSFQVGEAGAPRGSLVFDAAGNLYGTASRGGVGGAGSVFELSPQSGGAWTETVLYEFSDESRGYYPLAGVVFDTAGNLYGTTEYGGTSCGNDSCGTVFELSPQSGGGWAERVLHTFPNNGALGGPVDSVIFDTAGNLYGVTPYGGGTGCGGDGCGTAFKLSPGSGGTGGNWCKRDIYKFTGSPQGGELPAGSLTFDPAGNLWGATEYGGSDGVGTVFELVSGGNWKEKIRHNFKGGKNDGNGPAGPLVLDPAGTFYGTTQKGGSVNGGTVFELTP